MRDILCYDEPLFRPPSEADALIIQATIGCSHNRCTFCEMYTSKKFRVRPLKDIAADITAAARFFPNPAKVFLADGDALVLPARMLAGICRIVFETFPSRPRISAYACPQNMLAKLPEDLRAIREAGISLIYYGVESGHDAVLERVHKGSTAEEMQRGLGKAHEAGFATSVTWILGLGGRLFSAGHARATALLLSRCGPTYTSALTLMLPWGPDRLKRDFPEWEEISPVETLAELLLFVQTYGGGPTTFRCNHASNYLPLRATLPADREKLVALLRETIADPEGKLKPECFRGL